MKSDLMSQLIRPLILFPALVGLQPPPLISTGDGDSADGEEGTWKWGGFTDDLIHRQWAY